MSNPRETLSASGGKFNGKSHSVGRGAGCYAGSNLAWLDRGGRIHVQVTYITVVTTKDGEGQSSIARFPPHHF